MSCVKKIVFIFLVLAAAGVSSAMDIKQAFEAALRNDAGLGAARAAARAGEESVPQARAQLLPNLQASFSRNRNELSTRVPNIVGQLVDSNNHYPSSSDNVTLRQPLYRPYQWSNYKQAFSQLKDSEGLLDLEVQNLTVKVASAYFEALLAHDQLALVKSQKANQVIFLDAAVRMFAGGAGTRTDVDEAQARLDMSIAQELEAQQAVGYTLQQLEVLTGTPVKSLSSLDPKLLPLAPPSPADVHVWIARAEQSSPEMRVLKARAEVAKFEVEKTQSGHYPTLDAIAQWSRTESESNQSVNSRYQSRLLGVQLTLPLFAGGGVSSAIRQATANRERADQILEAGRRDLGIRVHKEYRGVSEGSLRIMALEQAARSAEQAVISSQKSFAGGSRTVLDVLNAQGNRMTVLRDLANARYMYLISKLRLLSLVEEANAVAIESINSLLIP